MTLQDYIITNNNNSITLTKQELQEAYEHFCKVADKYKPKPKTKDVDLRYGLYIGKADMLDDILKLFEQ